MELPPDPDERELWTRLARLQLIYSLAGLVFGLGCIVGGLGLFLHGVVGSTSWVAGFVGAQSKLGDAAPGTVLFIVGLLAVWVTRFSLRVGDSKSRRHSAERHQRRHDHRDHRDHRKTG